MKDDLAIISSIIDGRLHVRHNGRWLPVPSGGADGDPGEPTDPPAGDPPAPAEPAGDPPAGDPPAGDPPAEPGGGDDVVVPDVPEDLTAVDENALRDLHAALDVSRTSARSAGQVAQVRSSLDGMGRIVGELNRRAEQAAQDAADLAALDAAEVPTLPEPATPPAEPQPALAGSGASAAVLASVRVPQPAAAQDPPPPAPARPRVAILAAAGVEGVAPGTELDMGLLGQAIDRAKRGPEGRSILASLASFEEMAGAGMALPDILSDNNGAVVNDRLINEAVADWRAREFGAPALQASARQGAICEPFDIIREIPDDFSTSTPVADIFPSRPGGRGGWQFTPSAELGDVVGAVTLWNEDDQAAVDPDDSSTWKPCLEYDCPPIQTAILEAIVVCVAFPITLEMSNPERVANLNNAVGALRARTYEGRILQLIDSLSHPFVFSGDYGALPTFIEAVNSLLPQLSWWNRQNPGQYDMLIPPGALEVLAIDRAARAYGVEMEATDVLNYLQASIPGVRRIIQTMDPSLGGEPGTFSDPLPPVGNQANAGAIPYISGAAYRIRLVDPSAAIYAETGEMNAGVLRDANLVRQNRVGYFTEQFFTLAKHGPQPWATIDLELCADGARAGLVDPTGCTTS